MATSPSDLGQPRFCLHGHDTWLVGRIPGIEECCACSSRARICPQGHDTWETGRYASCGGCRSCQRAHARTRQAENRRRARHAGRPKTGGGRPRTGRATTEDALDAEAYLQLDRKREDAATWWDREAIEAQMAAMVEEAKR